MSPAIRKKIIAIRQMNPAIRKNNMIFRFMYGDR